MTETSSIIFENMFARLRSTVFGTNEQIIPMSNWKCHKMEEYISIANNVYEPYDANIRYKLINIFQEKRRLQIFDEERHAIDTSTESLELLNIIIYNADQIAKQGISLSGIELLGQYLRTKGHKVDYVKLDSWISRLMLRRMVSLLSSALLYIYKFDQDELPFLYKNFPEVKSLVCNQIENKSQNGILHHCSTTFRYSPLISIGLLWQKARNSLNSIEE